MVLDSLYSTGLSCVYPGFCAITFSRVSLNDKLFFGFLVFLSGFLYSVYRFCCFTGLEIGFCCEITFLGMGEIENRSSGFFAFGLSKHNNQG
jgi:hypothetical protein